MDSQKLENILRLVSTNELSVEEAADILSDLPFSDMDFAKLDWHRELRQGYPEAVYCPGKTADQLTKIAAAFMARETVLLATKASDKDYEAIQISCPDATYFENAKLVVAGEARSSREGLVVVVSAGTSDIPIAEEAAITAETMGARVERVFDVGVAGIHRLMPSARLFRQARALVVVAGMEGALPSFVGGMVGAPIIAVPTSSGYGASFNGVSALLGMLNSCATGVAVVNIDNGYGGGVLAALINNPQLYLSERS